MAKRIYNDNPNYIYSYKTWENGKWIYHTTRSSIRRYEKYQKQKKYESSFSNQNSYSCPNRTPTEAEYKFCTTLISIVGIFFIFVLAMCCPIPVILFGLWLIFKK